MTAYPPVRVTNAAIDEVTIDGVKKVILRGVIDPLSLQCLQTDGYQREAQPLQGQSSILSALMKGEPLPDIELGMRGQNFEEVGGVTVLKDPVFIVDGLQRVTTALHVLNTQPGKLIHLGATIHFDTNRQWEKDRFHKLNSSRLKMSPSILLRNMQDESPAVRAMYALSTNDNTFALHGRVQWGQRMNKGELVPALVFLRTVGVLHTHKSAAQRTSIGELVPALDRAHEVLKVKLLRDNMRTFFDLMDECWGIRRISYREGARHLRGTFLFALAKVLSDHTDFWQGDDDKLFVNADLRKKIKTFPVNTDQHVGNLTGSSGKARAMLYIMLVDHINSSKRTKKLTSRHPGEIGLDEQAEAA